MCDDFSKARRGDRVFSLLHGWGVVTTISKMSDYPLAVNFECGRQASFTFSGKYLDRPEAEQVLFWGEPSIVAPPMPPRKVKVKRWIKGRYTGDGRVFLVGCDMYPYFYTTKEAAEADEVKGLPIAFIAEVEVLENS